ncbi:MAG TPA: tetratricopeptide repeat protein [Acidobacteriaceae bacterium]|nr:tetratricopeptide repeat protein [Acidobacteriaceae bacterium]
MQTLAALGLSTHTHFKEARTTVPVETPVTRYSRQDVLRILHLRARQLSAWEKAGLVPATEQYSFEDLAQLRAVHKLRSTRITARNIRESVEAMRKCVGMANPLIETTAVGQGSRLSFRHSGALVDPVTRQLAFDFDAAPARHLSVVGAAEHSAAAAHVDVQEIFQRAVQLEEDPATLPQAADLYREILTLRPNYAAAAINLGTIHYNMREHAHAEELYRRATEADPDYALAFFDLGNVLDELKRLPEAIAAYERAIHLVPQYADAHYNLALALERQGHRRRALRHWLEYVRLDPVGPWAAHAKTQAKKILAGERLRIVCRAGRLVQPVQQAG